jgi:hypothetical protein
MQVIFVLISLGISFIVAMLFSDMALNLSNTPSKQEKNIQSGSNMTGTNCV